MKSQVVLGLLATCVMGSAFAWGEIPAIESCQFTDGDNFGFCFRNDTGAPIDGAEFAIQVHGKKVEQTPDGWNINNFNKSYTQGVSNGWSAGYYFTALMNNTQAVADQFMDNFGYSASLSVNGQALEGCSVNGVESGASAMNAPQVISIQRNTDGTYHCL